jgi:protein-S-isoprenylcysteine O-methyltransferase Ste14
MSRGMWYLVLSIPIIPMGLFLYRRDYRRWGRTRTIGFLAAMLCFLMPNLVLWRAGPFPPPMESALEYVGLVPMAVGLALCLIAMNPFRSSKMVMGMDQPVLVRQGFYRWSRNPQYIFWGLFLAGYALMINTLLGWVAIALYLAMMRGTVHVEEEHLERLFGEDYRAFKREVPRFVGFRKS